MNRKLIAALVVSLALPFAAMAADSPIAKDVKTDTVKAEAKTEKVAKKAKTKTKKAQPRKGRHHRSRSSTGSSNPR